MPRTGLPTVPIRRLSLVVIVETPVVSDIPQTSRTGIPSPRKNFNTSGGIAAAPDPAKETWSRPSAERTLCSTRRSARPCVRPPEPLPSIWACAAEAPARNAQSASAFLTGLDSSVNFASIPARIFCHTRGTPKKNVGCTSGRAAAISRGSGTVVIWMPRIMLAAWEETRSAMCAAGRYEMARSSKPA